MHKECFKCDLKHVDKLNVDYSMKDQLKIEIIHYLNNCDMSKSNPEIMNDIWEIMTKKIKIDNPYDQIKSYYNQFLMSLLPDIISYIHNDLYLALKMAILANLIDFSAKDAIGKEDIMNHLFHANQMTLAIDDSLSLFELLSKSQSLLYIGDNCGEIILDKLLISMLKERYQISEIYYGVRGKPIVNDVTVKDCEEIGMSEVAKVINTGDGSLGTVLERTSLEFQDVFHKVDVIICKGQGNYEGLFNCCQSNIFFMFMVKCDIIARISGTKINDIVCMQSHYLK